MENETDNENLEEEEEQGTMQQWLQDNLRIIISIVIVIAIAGGIYSYSKRTAAPTEETSNQASITEELGGASKEGAATAEKIGGEKTTTEKATGSTTATQVTSQETANSFVETAVRGDSSTKLARRALANYLEKNTDSALTPEHKIYIEDYLRKNVPKKSIRVGTSVEFSKDLIQNAISKSKTLNERQLQNLHQYAVRVPSLS